MDCINKEKAAEKVLSVIYGDCTMGVHGESFDYLFSYSRGGMESLVIDGKEWLYRTPAPAFWRATTDNDRGSKFPEKSGMWLAADLFIKCEAVRVWTDGKEIENLTAPDNNSFSDKETAKTVKIAFTYQTITLPAARTEVSYEISAEGVITVRVHYFGNSALPELPVFGLRFIMPTAALGYKYCGLSGETYPDRMAGAKTGVYEVEGMPVTKYLVPQDCGVHMETEWLEVYRNTSLDNSSKDKRIHGLCFTAGDRNFAFSCLPYTPFELENATHQEELPPVRRCVVSILGAVRGVGGIDSWGADVEESCHIEAGKDIEYSFTIAGV